MFQATDWVINQNLNENEFTGTIVGIRDPNKNNRAQVRIPFLHNGIPDEYLPWFRNGNVQGNVKDRTEVKLPVLGARVKVTFENDNFYNGTFYDGYKSNENIDTDFMQDYGEFDGFKDQWGNSYKRYSDGKVIFKTNQGVTIKIEGTSLSVTGVTDTYVESTETFKVKSKTSTFEGDVIITGAQTVMGTQTVDKAVTFNADTLYMGGKNINSGHRHGGVQGGSGSTSGVN